MNEGEISVCLENGGVEEDEPDVDTKGGLRELVVRDELDRYTSYHAIAVALDALIQNLQSRRLQPTQQISVWRPVSDQPVQRESLCCWPSYRDGAAAARGGGGRRHVGCIAVGSRAGAGILLGRREVALEDLAVVLGDEGGLVTGLLAESVGGLQASQSSMGARGGRRVKGRGGLGRRDGGDRLFCGRGSHGESVATVVVPALI